MNKIEPTFSIVIPTYNRSVQLTNCLSTLEKQNCPQNFWEVIVVNDGGTALEEIIPKFNNSLKIKLINQKNQGPALARNRGATESQADFLVFIDDDCFLKPDWLRELAKKCQTNPQSMIGGKTINAPSKNLYSTASQMIVDVAYQYYNFCPQAAQFFASNNMIVPRLSFLKLGGFHPDFRTSEDRELCDRWLGNGYSMIYDPSIELYHSHRLNLLSFWRQHLSYGRGAFNFHQIRFQRGAPPFRPDLSFHQKLVIHPFRHLPIYRALIVVVLMFISQLASTVGYFQEKQKASVLIETLSRNLEPLNQKNFQFKN